MVSLNSLSFYPVVDWELTISFEHGRLLKTNGLGYLFSWFSSFSLLLSVFQTKGYFCRKASWNSTESKMSFILFSTWMVWVWQERFLLSLYGSLPLVVSPLLSTSKNILSFRSGQSRDQDHNSPHEVRFPAEKSSTIFPCHSGSQQQSCSFFSLVASFAFSISSFQAHVSFWFGFRLTHFLFPLKLAALPRKESHVFHCWVFPHIWDGQLWGWMKTYETFSLLFYCYFVTSLLSLLLFSIIWIYK